MGPIGFAGRKGLQKLLAEGEDMGELSSQLKGTTSLLTPNICFSEVSRGVLQEETLGFKGGQTGVPSGSCPLKVTSPWVSHSNTLSLLHSGPQNLYRNFVNKGLQGNKHMGHNRAVPPHWQNTARFPPCWFLPCAGQTSGPFMPHTILQG